MKLVSLDISIQSTGITIYNSDTEAFKFGVVSSKLTGIEVKYHSDILTIDNVKHLVTNDYLSDYYNKAFHVVGYIVANVSPKEAVIVVERASFGANGKLFNMGTYYGMIVALLTQFNYKVQEEISSSTWKKYHGISKRGLKKIDYIHHAETFPEFKELTIDLDNQSVNLYKKGGLLEDVCDSYLMCRYYLSKFK